VPDILPEVSASILLVEDDAAIREIVSAFLIGAGFAVTAVGDVAGARARFDAGRFDLAIVDVNLPDGSGLALVERLRARRDCAFIYMTSLGAADDRLRGLETGDDYLVKPIDMRELVARVRAVLRRTRPPPTPLRLPVLALADWTLDLVRRELADPSGAPVRLTRAEFDLLAALAQAGDTALSRDYLLEVVASAEADTKARTIDVMISRIRRKLAAAPQPAPRIVTRPGEGYGFAPPLARSEARGPPAAGA
jgi:DNA-binding response OmpR family regulator